METLAPIFYEMKNMTKRFIGPYNQANENHAIHFILEFMIQSHNVTVSILRHKAALTSFLSIAVLGM